MAKASAAQQLCAGVDIKWFRDKTKEELDVWRKNQINRYRDPQIVDDVVELDKTYRAKLQERVLLSTERGKLVKRLNPKDPDYAKTNEEIEQVKAQSKELSTKIDATQIEVDQLFHALEKKLCLIGCLLHEDVPISDDEANNKVIVKCGKIPTFAKTLAHHQLLAMIDGYEPERGNRIAGHRGYYLKGSALKLNQALFRYGLDFLASKGFTPIHTPFFMKKDSMERVCQLEDFEETLYNVVDIDKNGSINQDSHMFLIATSEQPLCGFHLNEVLEEKELPKRYAGFSSCFRKEAGASGKDNWGIFRVHQFEKVEQFCITSPLDGESWKVHQEMVDNSCEFLSSLGLPFRCVLIVSKELNYSTSRKVDVEGWFPSFGDYKELVSASNCIDFQSRKMDIRFRPKKDNKEKLFVHMLNATLCATERTLCAILENYQTPDGIIIPKVLQPYFLSIAEEAPENRKTSSFYNNSELDPRELAEKFANLNAPKVVDFIPFVKPIPKN